VNIKTVEVSVVLLIVVLEVMTARRDAADDPYDIL
jgi:hypothetical protein